MTVIFYIQIGAKEHIGFGNPLDEIAGNATAFDLDNHSDQITLHYAMALLEKAARIVIVIREYEPSAPGPLSAFFEKVIRCGEKPRKAYSLSETSLPPGIKAKLGVEVRSLREVVALLRELVAS